MKTGFSKTYFIYIFFVFMWSSLALAQSLQLREENELIMNVALVDGTNVAEAMTVYRIENDWYLPLGQLMESLNVSISVSANLGKAEGDFVDPSHHFVLERSQCQAQFNSQSKSYDCDKVISHNDEIYVDSKLLELWFPMKLKFDAFASQISIESPLKFPEQARKEREKSAAALTNSKNTQKDNGYEFHPFPSQKVSAPILDQQLTTAYDQNKQTKFHQDTSASMELMGFQSKAYIGGTENNVDQWSLNFSKKDPQGQLLGDLHAQEIQAFDINLPTMPLILSSTRTRGILVSNFSLSQPSNFTSKDFRGPLPTGWEVELYQNDLLVGRQVAGASTEYEFKDLQLTYGVNRFRFVFYGPQGQRREEIETVNIGQNLVRPNEKNYRLAIGNRVDPTGTSLSERRTLLQYQQGLTSNWSASSSYLETGPNFGQEGSVHYGLLGIYGSLSRLFLAFNMAANDRSGQAFEQSIQAPFDRGSLGLSYTSLSNFQSDLYNQTNAPFLQQITKLNATWSFADLLSLRLTGEVADRHYEDHQSTVVTQRSSWKTGPLLWFNTVTNDPEAYPSLSGQLSSVAQLSGLEFRPTVDYSQSVDALGAVVQKRISEKVTVEAGLRDSYKESKKTYSMTFNRIFQNFTLSGEGSTDSTGAYAVTGLLSYSALMDPASHLPAFFPQPQADLGAISAHVYLDLDQSGTFTPGDTELEGIQILVNQNETKALTDANGHVLLTQLPAYEFVDLTISAKSLPDPLYKPAQKGIRILPRPGIVFEMDIPVIILSEMDGLVEIGNGSNQRGKGKIEVQLLDASGKVVSKSTSASDGFFVIENIKQGEYELLLNPDQLREMGLESRPKSYKISVPASGLNNSSFDFSLEKSR